MRVGWFIVACMLIATFGVREVVMAEEPETEPEVKTKVRIEIGQASFGYQDEGGEKARLPEVPIGEYFKVKVKWSREAERGQTLALRNFRYAVFEPELAFKLYRKEDSEIWTGFVEADLLLDRDDSEVRVREVSFPRPGSGDYSEAILKFVDTDVTKRILGSVDGLRPPTGALLIFFDVELTDSDDRVFYFDPPWAGKRGGG